MPLQWLAACVALLCHAVVVAAKTPAPGFDGGQGATLCFDEDGAIMPCPIPSAAPALVGTALVVAMAFAWLEWVKAAGRRRPTPYTDPMESKREL